MRAAIAVGLALAALSLGGGSAQAYGWCKFDPSRTSHMVCGYSSRESCDKAKTASRRKHVCVPDPFVARRMPAAPTTARS
jgi:hypothetical protein